MKLLLKKSYLSAIENSIGSNQYRNLYFEINGEERDIMKDGELSCALFVSSILHRFKLISSLHATVSGTEKDLFKSVWEEIEDLREGAVIIWSELDFNGEKHGHIGFYWNGETAISNSSIEKNTAKTRFVLPGQ